nr:hypothetical protein [Tanacetum cinerariifolium]
MIEFKVNDISSKLGLYVVDNFDETKMERTNANMHKTLEREHDVQGEVVASEIGVNEQTYGSVVNNETKVLTPLSISVYTPNHLVGNDFLFHGRKVVTKSNFTRLPYYQRVVDVDGALSSEKNFGRYLYGLNHIKAGNGIKAELEIVSLNGKQLRSDLMQVAIGHKYT